MSLEVSMYNDEQTQKLKNILTELSVHRNWQSVRDAVLAVIKAGADPKVVSDGEFKFTALFAAIYYDDNEFAKQIIQHHTNVFAINQICQLDNAEISDVLCLAIEKKDFGMAIYLVENGALVNGADVEGKKRPLIALWKKLPEINDYFSVVLFEKLLTQLLRYGADPSLVDVDGYTVFNDKYLNNEKEVKNDSASINRNSFFKANHEETIEQRLYRNFDSSEIREAVQKKKDYEKIVGQEANSIVYVPIGGCIIAHEELITNELRSCTGLAIRCGDINLMAHVTPGMEEPRLLEFIKSKFNFIESNQSVSIKIWLGVVSVGSDQTIMRCLFKLGLFDKVVNLQELFTLFAEKNSQVNDREQLTKSIEESVKILKNSMTEENAIAFWKIVRQLPDSERIRVTQGAVTQVENDKKFVSTREFTSMVLLHPKPSLSI